MVHASVVRIKSMNIVAAILDIVHFAVHLRMVHAPIVHSKNTSTAAMEKNVYIVDLPQLVPVLIVLTVSMNDKTSVEWATCCPLALISIFRLPENQSIFSNNLQKGNTKGKR